MSFFGILFAVGAALVWGGGDFSGGYATRRNNPFQVLAIAAPAGLLVLLVCALLRREPFPSGTGALLALLAGVIGSLGLAALYRGLAVGNAAMVAPTAGVLGAALPVAYTAIVQGAPAPARILGFAVALAGIFLVSRMPGGERTHGQPGFLLAVLAGISFGVFFILIHKAGEELIFTPLILSRAAEFGVALLILALSRSRLPSVRANPVAALSGVLDAGGNVLYILAGQFVRLDVAVVISSFYPAGTVALSTLLLKEKVSRGQQWGVLLCLGAIILITV